MTSDKLLIVALETLRRQMSQLPMEILAVMAKSGAVNVPGLTPETAGRRPPPASPGASVIDPDTGMFVDPGRPKPAPAKPPAKGYAEAGPSSSASW